jgi:hypothetical protein
MVIDALPLVVVDILSKYIVDKGATLLDEVGQTAVQAASQLYALVRGRLKGDPADARIATRFEENPEGYRIPVADAITEQMDSDPDFAAQLSTLLQEYKKAASLHVSAIKVASGAVATHGGIAAGEGGVAVAGNVAGGININNTQTTYSSGRFEP